MLSCTGTDTVLTDSSWHSGLARFHAVVLENIVTNMALGFVDEFNLVTGRHRLDSGHMRATLRRAAAVPGRRSAVIDLPVDDDPLVKAMTVIARELSGVMPSLGAHERDLPHLERLQSLASSARLRMREVRLPRGWWRRRGHACLAWDERNAPCALLPDGRFIRAIAKIRIAGAESRVFSSWMGSHAQQRYWMYRTRLVDNAVFTLTAAMPAMLALTFFSLAGTDLPPAPGDFVAFLTAFSGFTIGFAGVARELTFALSAAVHFDRIRPILDTAPETPARASPIGPLAGRVEIAHVTFRYHRDSAPVLCDISIRAEPGQFIAIAGPSGSGKSTLLRLLLGFEQPQSGAIFYDGQDLNRIDLDSARRQFGVVLQESQLHTHPGRL